MNLMSRVACTVSAGVVVVAALAAPASAAVVITVAEVGNDVVFTGVGTLDLTGSPVVIEGVGSQSALAPVDGVVIVGPAEGASIDSFALLESTFFPAFGSLANTYFATTGTGDLFGVAGTVINQVAVPVGYISGTPLSGSSMFENVRLGELGVVEGAYSATLASGDTITLIIPFVEAVPEPTSAAMLGLGGLALLRRRRR